MEKGSARVKRDGGVRLWQSPVLGLFSELTHGLSLRTGGVSPTPWDSLNVGLHVGDEPANVLENRRRVAEAAGAQLESWTCAQQVHGDHVRFVGTDELGRGATVYDEAISGADALVTKVPGAVLTVFVADCAPVLLYDPAHRAVGLAHAGWRGLVAGIVPKTVRTMESRFGTKPGDLLAAVGPSLGPCCFEVGTEVAEQFDSAHVVSVPGMPKPNLDPWSAVHAQLRALGVPSGQIDAGPPCTKCNQTEFFSYRGAGGRTGRMVAFLRVERPRRLHYHEERPGQGKQGTLLRVRTRPRERRDHGEGH